MQEWKNSSRPIGRYDRQFSRWQLSINKNW